MAAKTQTTENVAVLRRETALTDAISAYLDSGGTAIATLAQKVAAQADAGLTPAECTLAIRKLDWGGNKHEVPPLRRLARAICEVPKSGRKARVSALLKAPDGRTYVTIGAIRATMEARGWGKAEEGAGAGGGKKRGTKAKVALPKMTAGRLAEVIAANAGHAEFMAALNKALHDSGFEVRAIETEV